MGKRREVEKTEEEGHGVGSLFFDSPTFHRRIQRGKVKTKVGKKSLQGKEEKILGRGGGIASNLRGE